MAIMIPGEGPRQFEERSQEGRLYDSLSLLSDDFYVVHSLDLSGISAGALREGEADFVVFNPELGILCIEAKSGRVRYSQGNWLYASGIPMRHDGPYNQAKRTMHLLMDTLTSLGLSKELESCKMMYAVWFPSLTERDLRGANLPSEASLNITLTADDLAHPEVKIRKIMSAKVGGKKTGLTSRQANRVLEKVICPQFDIIPSRQSGYRVEDMEFVRLLDSQARVLNFLQDQQTAVIAGGAGTGKTLIAIERAKQAAQTGSVLFLCFNALLKEDIAQRLSAVDTPYPIDVYTISGFAMKQCGTMDNGYERLANLLAENAEAFPYKHVVIDEAQDFGIKEIDDAMILDLLRENALDADGTFYAFYDKNQFIQGTDIPTFITEADCKLSLYVNCRNTANIATCSQRSIKERKAARKLQTLSPSGQPPQMLATKDHDIQIAYIKREIARFKEDGLRDIVILTCKTEERSAFADLLRESTSRKATSHGIDTVWEGLGIPFSTCRKFKGLEADAIILVDVDGSVWREPSQPYAPESGLLFYTGASRAKHELRLVCDMDENECKNVLEALEIPVTRSPANSLAKHLNAIRVNPATVDL